VTDGARTDRGPSRVQVLAAVALGLTILVSGLVLVYLVALILTAPMFGIAPLVNGQPAVAQAIMATAAVAGAVRPLHRRCDQVARRLLRTGGPSRYKALAALGQRLATLSGSDEALTAVAAIVTVAIGARRTDVWLLTGAEWFAAAGWARDDVEQPNRPQQSDAYVELRHGAVVLGALSVLTTGGAPPSPAQAQLLDDMAGQAALVLRTAGLTAQLRARLAVIARQRAELRSARRRMLTAADTEQRRFERELAEGPLAELDTIEAAICVLAEEPARLPELLPELLPTWRRQADAAISKLRDLARGVYPPVLRDSGLALALHARYRHSGAPVTVHAEEARLPADIELIAYLAGCDAVSAALRRGATDVEVTLGCTGRTLRLTVGDDGDPGWTCREDVQAAADCVVAAGGALRLEPAARAGLVGTVVEITLPVLAEDAPS